MSRPMDELQQLLKNLHLSRMAEGLPEELQRADARTVPSADGPAQGPHAPWDARLEGTGPCPGRGEQAMLWAPSGPEGDRWRDPPAAARDKGGSISVIPNQKQGSDALLSSRSSVVLLVALLSVLLGGCIVLPAKAKVAQIGDVPTPSRGVALSVIFSRDFSPKTPRSLGDEMVECITRGLAEVAPELRLVPEEEFHRAVFGVKPGEVLLRADTIGMLLARPDIRQRVADSGLTHLILVGGATHSHSHSNLLITNPVHPSAIAVGDSTRSTQLTASIFELARGGEVVRVQARAEGRQGLGSISFILWVGWVHATETSSCKALGAGVAGAIGGKPRDDNR